MPQLCLDRYKYCSAWLLCSVHYLGDGENNVSRSGIGANNTYQLVPYNLRERQFTKEYTLF